MEKKSNGTLVGILIGIIIMLVVGICLFATGTIGFKDNATNNNGQTSENNQTSNNENGSISDNNSESQTEPSWVDYLLSRHLSDAKISRFRSKEVGDNIDLEREITISIDDVKEVLSKLKNVKLSKVWTQGMGAPYDRDHLTITYENNEKNYEFSITYGSFIFVDKLDEDFKKILDNSKYEEKNIENRNAPGSFYYYDLNDNVAPIFDKYFK